MEAATLKKKTVNKSKLKKSIKSVLCRPDPVFWPETSKEEASKLENILNEYKVVVSEYKKPHWNEIKSIPKEKRPKQPTIPKIEGLIFGISECNNTVQSKQCTAVIIEATVNPRTIVEPLLEKCYTSKIPVVCLENLRKLCAQNYGIGTSCLGIRNNSLTNLQSEIMTISKRLKYPEISKQDNCMEAENEINTNTEKNNLDKSIKTNITESPYLYRTSKKTRVFIPSETNLKSKNFSGQDFIEFSNKTTPTSIKPDRKLHMRMILKRMSNNQNRVKRK